MRLIKAILLALISAAVASAIVYFAFVRPRVREWGLDPHEAELPLPGDDLVAQPSAIETRGITIAAPVAKVWPWLIQMGFGRAGWYSYDVLDNRGKAPEGILAEFQALAPGDIMPTHPGGGFVVKEVQPERTLVLYTDAELLRSQAEQARAQAGPEDTAQTPADQSGASSFPEFSASWAFYLQPTEDGMTRLIERFRVKTPGSGPATAVLGEIMGTGVVLLTRKQMIGIKERVERTERELTEPVSPTEPWATDDSPMVPSALIGTTEPAQIN